MTRSPKTLSLRVLCLSLLATAGAQGQLQPPNAPSPGIEPRVNIGSALSLDAPEELAVDVWGDLDLFVTVQNDSLVQRVPVTLTVLSDSRTVETRDLVLLPGGNGQGYHFRTTASDRLLTVRLTSRPGSVAFFAPIQRIFRRDRCNLGLTTCYR